MGWWKRRSRKAQVLWAMVAFTACLAAYATATPGQERADVTPTGTPSVVQPATDTAIPTEPMSTRTVTPSITPSPTPTAAPPATLTPLERRLTRLEGVKTVRLATMWQSGEITTVYLEIDTLAGYNTAEMATELYREALSAAVAAYGSQKGGELWFSAILWDGQGPAIDYTWDNESDTWQTTTLSVTPEA